MKYWKNGFYDELVEGAVEITEEYYNQLLNGQSAGLLIVDNQNGYPILVEYEYSFEDVIKNKVTEIAGYLFAFFGRERCICYTKKRCSGHGKL